MFSFSNNSGSFSRNIHSSLTSSEFPINGGFVLHFHVLKWWLSTVYFWSDYLQVGLLQIENV